MPGGKAPGEMRAGSWQRMGNWPRFGSRQPSEFEVKLWVRYPDAGVGLVLGSAIGEHFLVAVDIDVDDAEVFDELVRQLPHSPMRKRGAKGETRFYRAPKTIRSKGYNRAADRKRLVDVLTGFDTRQTVCPPTIHPSGAEYAWLAGPVAARDLPLFDEDALTRLEEALSAAGWDPSAERPGNAKALRSQPPDPDDYWSEVKAAALANLNAWVPELDLHGLRRARGGYEAVATWRPSGSGRPLEQRKRNLSIQANGISDFGDGPKGYSAIDLVMAVRGCEQSAATTWLRERLGLVEAPIFVAPAPASHQPLASPPKPPEPLGELPDELTRVPGLVGELTDWIADSSRRPQRGLALGAALTIVGTAAGRKYAGPTRSGTHLYVLGLARSGAGKDHALEAIATVLTSVGMKAHLGPSSFMSLSGAVNRIIRQPLTLCAMDEFGAYLTRINSRTARPDEKQISGVLREAWGKSFKTMPMPAWAHHEPDPVHAPALSVYGVSVPEELYKGLSGADISNGFLNRFLLISTQRKPTERDPKLDPGVVPDGIRAKLHRIYGSGSALASATMHNDRADGPMVTLRWANAPAKKIYEALLRDIEKREADADLLGRAGEIAVRLATIRAIGFGAEEIEADDMAWGRDLALWSAERIIAETSDYMAETQNQADAQRIVRILKERGPMKHGALVHAMQHRVKARDLKDLIGSLQEAGQILVEIERPPGGGPEGRRYTAR